MSKTPHTPRPLLGIISDETGESLRDCVAFANEQSLDQIEIRMVDGIAPLSLTKAEAHDAHACIRGSGLAVSGIATPLLKWTAPGKQTADLGDQFGFERAGRSDDDLIEAAIRIADIFETRHLRIFSYLAHDAFVLDDLKPPLDKLLRYAETHDKVLMMENEHVCNIARFEQLADLVEHYATPRLRALPDIANSAAIGDFPAPDLVSRVLAHADHIHFKDYSKSAGTFVALGTGDVRLDEYMGEVAAAARGRQLSFSLETHVHDDPLGGSTISAGQLIALTDRHFT